MGIGNPVTLTGNIDSKVISVTATSGQTQFTVTGGYNINALTVYRNGAKLTQGRDFTATDGATVTLITPAVLADVIDFHVFENHSPRDRSNFVACVFYTYCKTLVIKVEILSCVPLRGLARSPASARAPPLFFRRHPRRRNVYGQWKIGVSESTTR